MPSTTPKGLPYPLPTDPVAHGADDIKALALGVDGKLVTTSPLAGGPPASPVDGQLWIATGVDAAGTRWMFEYDAGESTANKWKFVGGPPVVASLLAFTMSNNGGVWVATGLNLLVARAGVYVVRGTLYGATTGGGNWRVGYGVNGAFVTEAAIVGTGASLNVTCAGIAIDLTVGAGQNVNLFYNMTAGGAANLSNAGLEVLPRKIG